MAQKQFIIDGGFKTNANSEIAGNLTVTDLTFTGVITGDGSGLAGVTSYASSDFSNDLASKTTDDLAEGDNLYFTDTRAKAAVSAGTGISYNSTTGVITNTITQYTDALAVSANTSAIATAKSEAAADATTKADAAISTAAADATTKANAAQAAAIAAVTNGAGAAFDTLKEIQDAMATDAELADAIAAISNVPSATKLQTARTINGASFDGTANISFSTSAVSEGTNLYYTDARARASHSFVAGSGAYNSSTGVITIPTNNDQLTNGAGYVTSSGVTAVTATGPVVSSGGATPVISMPAATASVDGYMTSTFASKLNGIAAGATNVTNTNQLTNGAGYVTSSGVTSIATSNGISGGTITSTGTLSLSGSYTGTWAVTGGITATADVTAYSDARLKENVEVIDGALEKVCAIRGVTFTRKSDGERSTGVIAQELQVVLPEAVHEDEDGMLHVAYGNVVGLLIQAIKELKAELTELKASK